MVSIAGVDEKRFKALSFVWLLFCFLGVYLYSENLSLDGLFIRIFLYGVFASPVWLLYGWSYLSGGKPVSLMFLIAFSFLYLIWAWGEDDFRTHQEWAAAACGVYFWVMALMSRDKNLESLSPDTGISCVGAFIYGCWQGLIEVTKDIVIKLAIWIPISLVFSGAIIVYLHFKK